MDTLTGKLALVTGASRGIGLAIAERFAADGARLALCARTPAPLSAAAERLRSRGAEVVAVACDVGSAADVQRFVAATEALGVPDVIVNNAGVVVRGRLDETSEADWDAVFNANLKGAFHLLRLVLPAMRARRSGRIVNIASISGRQGTAGLTAYCAAKHGLIGLTRALAEELRADQLQVNAICPGSVDTEMLKGSGYTPAMGPDAVASVAHYLAAAAPPALTGSCIDVFG